jgi:hypothetical protein
MFPPIYDALIAIRAALIMAVAPQLRGVTVDLDQKTKKLILYFFYDGEITGELFELASVAGTETNLPEYRNSEHIIRLDDPAKIPIRGRLAYLRKESQLPNFKNENRSYLLKETPPSILLLLDLQEALLGKVTPALRLAAGDIDIEQKCLKFYFIFDGKISDEDFKLAHDAIQEASVSFPNYQIDSRIERIDFPNEITSKALRSAYARYEKCIDTVPSNPRVP